METEGLYTLVWGGAQWESLHNITFNYPYSPTSDDKEKYRRYFFAIGDVLPCCACRKHFNYHIRNGDTKLTDAVLENRDSLTLWLFNLHTAVCRRLGYNYDITYDMLCAKHASYIATCAMTNEQKKKAFVNMYDVHAPVVPIATLLSLIPYATQYIPQFEKSIRYYASLSRTSDEWYARNQLCQEQIKRMRMAGALSLADDGLPTMDELKLMAYTSTTLPLKVIDNIVQKVASSQQRQQLLQQPQQSQQSQSRPQLQLSRTSNKKYKFVTG